MEQVGRFGKIYHVAAPRARVNCEYRVIYPTQFLSAGGAVQKILAAELPDLIEISDKYTLNYLGAMVRRGLVPALGYRPVVVGLSQERMDDNFRAYFGDIPFGQTFCSLYMKWLYFPFFDHHIANSEYTAAELRGAAQGQLINRETWIRSMGVDLDHLAASRRRPELRRRLLENFSVGEDAVLLLYAGRIVPEKNLQLLFDVVARLAKDSARDYRLLMVGDGIDREMWEQTCSANMRERVLFLGHVRDKNVLADLYANSDVFVHPNPREPFGIALLEAMASGLPLVAPNCGGVTSYANPENAWTVSADVESFAQAIREAAGVPEVTARKVRKALETAQKYRWQSVAPSFLDLYEDLWRVRTGAKSLPESAFSSTSATGVRAALMSGVAQFAKASFQAFSWLDSFRRPRATQPSRINGRKYWRQSERERDKPALTAVMRSQREDVQKIREEEAGETALCDQGKMVGTR